MAFNPYYQPNYYNPMGNIPDAQQMYRQPYQQATSQITMPVANERIWTQGIAGAKAYIVAPGNTVILWDSEAPIVYVKSADLNGVPSLEILDYTKRNDNALKMPSEHVCKCGDKFVTKEQFESLQGKYGEIMAMIEEIKSKPTAKATKTTKESVE